MPQQQTQLNKTVIAQQQKFNLDSLDTCSDNDDVVCYQAVSLSEQLWNASNLLFGSFHQNDVRFSEQSRGYQCTCNALCMLSYATCMDTEKSFILDKVLCEGDTLYKSVIEKLKSEGKFIHCLLNLEEIPDDFNIEIGKFITEKLPIKSGFLVDTEGLGSPTLHEILQEAFLSVSSGLLTIGSICSAVFMKNGMYVFFDSHSHGKNGLTSSDGASCLITFSSFDDLVRYMYAFYDSLKLDSNIQFDFLPLKVHKTENTQRLNDQMNSNLEAYFIDQRLRQAHKTQRKVRSISNNASSIFNGESIKHSGAKKGKDRSEYYKVYKRRCRQNAVFKAKEIIYQRDSKQSARKNSVYRTKERESKQSARKDPVFKAKESVYQKESKQSARKDPVFKAKESVYQKESKQSARKNTVYRTKERESKQSARKDPVFKAKESVYQKES